MRNFGIAYKTHQLGNHQGGQTNARVLSTEA